ncbi:spore coat associated protein CotJA [Bacillus velezensis]|nr:spore coat associated protein CotJA [Bacillus velezensis]
MKENQPFTPVKSYKPFHSRFDPCPPIGRKYFRTPPHLYMRFQPYHLEQFSPMEALRKGTLWKDLYDFYDNPYRGGNRIWRKRLMMNIIGCWSKFRRRTLSWWS